MNHFRRLAALWCLSAVLCGQVAQARIALVYQRPDSPAGNLAAREGAIQQKRNARLVASILRSSGNTDFLVRQTGSLNTEMARSGLFINNAGNTTPAAWGRGVYSEQVEAVVLVGSATNILVPNTARFDSLTMATRQASGSGHAVPMLQLRDNSSVLFSFPPKFGAGVDSVGVTADENGPGKAIYFANDHNAWLSHAYVAGSTGFYDTGDIRRILFGGTPAYEARHSMQASGGIVPCNQCDSLGSYAANDTLILWDRQYDKGIRQARTMVFANAFGAGAAYDSLSNFSYIDSRPPTEGDFTIILAALAHLDSLVRADTTAAGVKRGGKVLGDKVIKIAPIVYGGLARGERHSWKSPGAAQGILASDTSAFYATLDSIATLGIPITFAINPDSASSYERDLIKMKQVGMARFTPQVWNGVADSTKAGGQNAKYRPVDVFGRYRNRTAMGDGTGVGVDTGSVYTLARSALRLVDSLTSGRVSRIAVAPDDDWSPLNTDGVLKLSSQVRIDSVMYALQQAGFRGVVADAQDPDASASKRNGGPSKTNPRGYYNRQQVYASGSISGLRDFKILTHTGYAINGSRSQAFLGTDSTGSSGGWLGLVYKEISRVWSGALLDLDNSYDTWPSDDMSSAQAVRSYDDIHQRKVDRTQAAVGRPVVRGNIYRISCADLSGVPNGPPARPAYHVLKAMKNAMTAIDKLAGRTVVMFDYPEDIEP